MLKDRVKTLRKAKGWSQKELAAEAKVSQQAIGKIETGKSQETRKLPQIAAALGVSAEELTDKKIAKKQPATTDLSHREHLLIDAFRKADDLVKRAIEGAAGLPFEKRESGTTKATRAKSSRIQTY